MPGAAARRSLSRRRRPWRPASGQRTPAGSAAAAGASPPGDSGSIACATATAPSPTCPSSCRCQQAAEDRPVVEPGGHHDLQQADDGQLPVDRASFFWKNKITCRQTTRSATTACGLPPGRSIQRHGRTSRRPAAGRRGWPVVRFRRIQPLTSVSQIEAAAASHDQQRLVGAVLAHAQEQRRQGETSVGDVDLEQALDASSRPWRLIQFAFSLLASSSPSGNSGPIRGWKCRSRACRRSMARRAGSAPAGPSRAGSPRSTRPRGDQDQFGGRLVAADGLPRTSSARPSRFCALDQGQLLHHLLQQGGRGRAAVALAAGRRRWQDRRCCPPCGRARPPPWRRN